MLEMELQLLHLFKSLEFCRLLISTLIVFVWHEILAEVLILKGSIVSTAKIASSLHNILGSPKCTIGNINVDCKTTNGIALGNMVTKTNRSVNTLHSLNSKI